MAVTAALLATAPHATQPASATAPGGARPASAGRPSAPPSDARLAAVPARHDMTREQFYFLLPDRFADGSAANDRGGLTGDRTTTGYDPTDKGFYQGGDLKGLISKLDYVKGLGTTAIWLAPIFKNKPVQGNGESAGYHGYWITDFTRVDPHFGTNADLAELIRKAHAKGMKVFFDVITNHTADTVTNTEKTFAYRGKGAYPYLDTEGRPFDDTKGMRKIDARGFPYTPQVTPSERNAKVPAWLNDPTMYHNRGDSTFAGESTLYGDHTGLDDLWTERPEVVRGMEKIYEKWVDEFRVDGFRVDTVRNVDMEFWTQWATALDAHAAKKGRKNFFVFGETLSSDPAVTSPYVRQGRLDATLDFPLQDAVRQYASQGRTADRLADVFAQDYRYTTDKANAYEQVTFLGNHDMGRIGAFLLKDNPGAGDAELPYDPSHPLYRAIAALSRLTRDHPALRDGVQTERYAQGSVYAFTRTDTHRRDHYLVAANNATEARTVRIATGFAGVAYRGLYGTTGTVTSGADTRVTVTIPPLSSVVLKAKQRIGTPATRPTLVLKAPAAGATGDVDVSADVSGGGLDRVVFAAQVGNGPWQTLGTADHAPYKVTQHLPDTVKQGTTLRYKAVAVDLAGRTASALATTTAGQTAAPRPPSALNRAYAVVHYLRPDGDYTGWRLESAGRSAEFTGRDAYGAFAWVKLEEGARSLTYTVTGNGTADGPRRTIDLDKTGEVWIRQGDDGQSDTAPHGAYPAPDPAKAVIHYHRADGDYDGWGLHTWTGAKHPTDWSAPLTPTGRDAFGVTFEVPLADGATSLSYIVHKGDEKDITADRSLDFATYGKETWLIGGDGDYLLPTVGSAPDLDLDTAKARWIGTDTVVWKVKTTNSTSQQLVYAPGGGITVKDGALSDEGHWLRLIPSKLTDAQKSAHPELADDPAFTVDPRDRDRVPAALRAQLIATQRAANGALLAATGVRLP
ncbi:alpha-amylase family glycosyl hydrolase [Streptomyces lavenduligriseus]|uniref:alpha-amylase family glycosyl hydrolase n=1 Tax=Streptomyces lavenduligriseus TaxID=67315 RepID=UPI003CC92217